MTQRVIADASKNTVTDEPHFHDLLGVIGGADVATDRSSSLIAALVKERAEFMESSAFTRLSEDSFAEDWDSPEDAVYDHL